MAKHSNTTLTHAASTKTRHAAADTGSHQQRAPLQCLQARSIARSQGPPQ
jgi:hypothetical protein